MISATLTSFGSISGQSRLVFSLVGPRSVTVILNLPQTRGFFPDAADAWVIGHDDGDTIQAATVLIRLGKREALWVDTALLDAMTPR